MLYLSITVILFFFLTFFLLRYFINNANRLGLIDIPNNRSSHKNPIPRGAGIIFGFSISMGIILFQYFQEIVYIYSSFALFIIYIVGTYDDLYDISANKKMFFIIIATILAFIDGFCIISLGNYFGYELSLGYLSLPFTVFAILGFTNAINLTDGLDGLASSISIVILSTLLFIGILHNDTLLIYIPILVITSLVAFLYFNWYPAKIFMGDSGSLFLGFILSLLSIHALEYINPSSILFLAAIPILDTFVVMFRRKQRGISLFIADKNHLHHILFNKKNDQLFAVSSLILIQIVFSLIFIQIYDKSDAINLIIFAIIFFIFYNLFDPRKQYRDKKN